MSSHPELRDLPGTLPRRLAITGASGFLGQALAGALHSAGSTVHRVRRAAHVSAPDIAWDPASGRIDGARFEGVDAVVHLAGESLARRWTPKRKRLIRESRVAGTQLLVRALTELRDSPKVLLSGSAIGFYGQRGDEELDEASEPGDDFLAEVTEEWERAAVPARAAGIRVVLLRTGIVLNPGGGALRKMLLPFKLGLGGRIGSGRQWMSWIALSDWVRAVVFLLGHAAIDGPVNLVAPNPVRNEEFVKTLGHVLHRPTVIPLPSMAVSLLFGEMGRATLLASQRVHPRRLTAAGFVFESPTLQAALQAET